ncbi:DUF4365 domain-containing protein [Hymenobacter koreensis]|uniref:DUF4365 domain-containing protein n=1 Tax=Hymenobacter koreensis TaxID=1084523 RepID=A0ABP8JEC2_9BACT
MAFADTPTVDDSSKKSEESELLVKKIFTKRKGFINREEKPDYGVDLDVELVYDGENASSQKFAIQIKSATELKKVDKDDETFISFTFKTSRLGYLCRRAPGYGIIVLYHDDGKGEGTAYYDYVDSIVRRVDAYNTNPDWKLQDSVQIYIPLTQILDDTAAAGIHVTVAGLYERHNLMLRAQGPRYNIPYFDTAPAGTVPPIDFNDPAQVAEQLEKLGGALFNEQEYDMLRNLLERLPASRISRSAQLSFLAAITYDQIGFLTEGEFYVTKGLRLAADLDPESRMLLELTRIRLAFLRGTVSSDSYTDSLNDLAATSTNPLNSLVLQINVLYMAAIAATDSSQSKPFDVADVEALFSKIEAAPLEEADKELLKLYNSDALQVYASNLYLQQGSNFKLREQAGRAPSTQERMAGYEALMGWLRKASQYAYQAYHYARDNGNTRLLAYAQQYISRFFLSLEFDRLMLTLDELQELDADTTTQYEKHLWLASEAYNNFVALKMGQDAHRTVGIIYDLQFIYTARFDRPLGTKPITETKDLLRRIEEDHDIPPFESAVERGYQGMMTMLQQAQGREWADMSEEQVNTFAQAVMITYDLPPERLPNVLADIQNHRLFEAACQDRAIIMLPNDDHMNDAATAYTEVPTYILVNRITEVETKPFQDVREVLDQLTTTLKTPLV